MSTIGLQRSYSKAKAVGNHVTWNGQVITVPFSLEGLVVDATEFGFIRVPGQPVYCLGLRVDFRQPALSKASQVSVTLLSGTGAAVPNGTVYINGTIAFGELLFAPPIPMPSGSIWKLLVHASGDPTVLPENLQATYWLSYANNPVTNTLAAVNIPELGPGSWQIGQTFVLQ